MELHNNTYCDMLISTVCVKKNYSYGAKEGCHNWLRARRASMAAADEVSKGEAYVILFSPSSIDAF